MRSIPRTRSATQSGGADSRPVTAGGLRKGARSIEIIEENGKRFEMETEILDLDPGRLLEVAIRSRILDGTSRYRLSSNASGTLLRFDMQARYKGVFRVFALFAHGAIRKKHEADLGRLKSAVESDAAVDGRPVR